MTPTAARAKFAETLGRYGAACRDAGWTLIDRSGPERAAVLAAADAMVASALSSSPAGGLVSLDDVEAELLRLHQVTDRPSNGPNYDFGYGTAIGNALVAIRALSHRAGEAGERRSCPTCEGRGRILVIYDRPGGPPGNGYGLCPTCMGHGTLEYNAPPNERKPMETCPTCNGSELVCYPGEHDAADHEHDDGCRCPDPFHTEKP